VLFSAGTEVWANFSHGEKELTLGPAARGIITRGSGGRAKIRWETSMPRGFTIATIRARKNGKGGSAEEDKKKKIGGPAAESVAAVGKLEILTKQLRGEGKQSRRRKLPEDRQGKRPEGFEKKKKGSKLGGDRHRAYVFEKGIVRVG